jgi:hypothetical protein
VTARDAITGDTISSRFPASVAAPALTFATVPTTLDSTQFARERTKRFGYRGVIVGGLVGAAIYNLSTLHGDSAFTKTAGVDSKGSGLAVAAAASVIAASFLDKGRRIPSAVAANQKIRDDFATSIQKTTAENANRIATYKTIITVTPGVAR